ncbi:MAG: DUF5518 domain-containing protein [Methanobacterium formicicum]
MKIEWKTVLIGVIMTFVLMFIFGFATGIFLLGFFGFIIAIIYVGYAVGKDFKTGALHGGLVGLIVIIIAESMIILIGKSIEGDLLSNVTIYYLLKAILVTTIVGAIGGLFGSVIKINKPSQEDKKIS